MAYEQRDNSGSLFKNAKKQKDSHPDTQGSAMIGGVEYWVDGWTKTRDNGDKWVSLAFKRKDAKAEKPAEPAKKAAADMDDAVPF